MAKEYKVAVYVHRGQNRDEILAYLRDYNPEWPGYNEVNVTAENGREDLMNKIERAILVYCKT